MLTFWKYRKLWKYRNTVPGATGLAYYFLRRKIQRGKPVGWKSALLTGAGVGLGWMLWRKRPRQPS